jgi:hypothetical protein
MSFAVSLETEDGKVEQQEDEIAAVGLSSKVLKC